MLSSHLYVLVRSPRTYEYSRRFSVSPLSSVPQSSTFLSSGTTSSCFAFEIKGRFLCANFLPPSRALALNALFCSLHQIHTNYHRVIISAYNSSAVFQLSIKSYRVYLRVLSPCVARAFGPLDSIFGMFLSPFSTAVPIWGQNTYNLTGLSPK